MNDNLHRPLEPSQLVRVAPNTVRRRNPLRILCTRLRDELRYNIHATKLFTWLQYLRGCAVNKKAPCCDGFLQAYRYAPCGSTIEARALKRLRPGKASRSATAWSDRTTRLKPYGHREEEPLTRTIVLKTPGERGEKGLLLASFEYNWLRLLRNHSAWKHLTDRFDIILSSSSSPTSYDLLGMAIEHNGKEPVYVMSCRYEEIPKLESFHPLIRCLPMLPCDWLEPSFYQPKPFRERSIDILMVAGWNPVKRHWRFFEALRELPKDMTIVLVGQPEGGYGKDWLHSLAVAHGVRQDLDIRESILIDEVTQLQCDSRTSTVFSRREGCCVAVTESLMADTPVGLIAKTSMGPASYITPETGKFLSLEKTARDLRALLEESDSFSPRKWAMANISNHVSAARLNRFFESEANRRNRPWTRPITTPCWRPHPTLEFADGKEDIEQCMQDLHNRFPDLFPEDLFWKSRR